MVVSDPSVKICARALSCRNKVWTRFDSFSTADSSHSLGKISANYWIPSVYKFCSAEVPNIYWCESRDSLLEISLRHVMNCVSQATSQRFLCTGSRNAPVSDGIGERRHKAVSAGSGVRAAERPYHLVAGGSRVRQVSETLLSVVRSVMVVRFCILKAQI